MGSLFDNFVGSFSKSLDNLTNPLTLLAASMNNLADKFGNFTMTHKVEISGLPDIDANLLGNQLGESIANKTVDQVQRRLDDNNNQFQGLA
jgi:NADH/NAD ratio-sensing transcriptional regulator Rex